ncbi:hypothetical protein [Streptomyces sp. bgisy022]|uniref:hypothetical protein n=1 Tax=Streptomyces sp. bgisy022 TaxID=3413769 RepID=UPI003D75437F
MSHDLPVSAPGTPDARRDALLAALPAYEAELFRTATEAASFQRQQHGTDGLVAGRGGGPARPGSRPAS